jgi:hypothetical protein
MTVVLSRIRLKGQIDAVEDVIPAPSQVSSGGRTIFPENAPSRLNNMHIRQPPLFQLYTKRRKGALPVTIIRFLQYMILGQTNGGPVAPHSFDNCIDDFQWELQPCFN